jgi:hypothetical protein
MVIVIGGHSRNIGKTSVICGIIRALTSWNWTAIKITSHEHDVREKTCMNTSADSDRFLAAGAARAFLVQSDAMPRITQLLAESENAIIESTGILRFLKPDVCAMVVNGTVPDFKPSALEFIHRANFLVLTSDARLAWQQVPPILLRNKPRFAAPPPLYQNAELVAAISSVTRAASLFGNINSLKTTEDSHTNTLPPHK